MFETLVDRAGRLALARAEARRREIAERLAAELPGGIRVETGPEIVRLAGRGLVRRILLDSRLRALMAEVVK